MDSAITVTGNLTRDPEIRFGDNGNTYTRFGIAATRRDKSGKETTSFYDVVSFGSTAANAGDSLTKGSRVLVHGRQEVREFERKDGTKGMVVEIVADEVAASLRFATVSISKNTKGDMVGAGTRSSSVPSGYEEF